MNRKDELVSGLGVEMNRLQPLPQRMAEREEDSRVRRKGHLERFDNPSMSSAHDWKHRSRTGVELIGRSDMRCGKALRPAMVRLDDSRERANPWSLPGSLGDGSDAAGLCTLSRERRAPKTNRCSGRRPTTRDSPDELDALAALGSNCLAP
jgi:hypothetical protein